MEIYNILI